MSYLFEYGGLQQETGRLQERWGQDGSDLVNVNDINPANGDTIYTVTAGKVLYVDVALLVDRGATGTFTITDGSGGSVVLSGSTGTNVGQALPSTLKSPLKFEDSVYFNIISGSVSLDITLSGWEE